MLGTLLFASLSAHAFVLEPVYRAADQAGYQVVGEVVFRAGSTRASGQQLRENFRELHEICPAAGLPERFVHFVILAWSDREFPAEGVEHPHAQQILALQRGRAIADVLRLALPDPRTSFEVVNMASHQAQTIHPGSAVQQSHAEADVKKVLVREGAAPRSDLEAGLFGEYGQRSKAILWVDCRDSGLVPRRSARPEQGVQLASTRGFVPGMGHF
jgi:hypothetical protein